MRPFKFLRTIVGITLLSLIYINLQMQIFDLAYEGKRKEKEIRRLHDHNSQLTYHILNLKSANHLGDKLLTQDARMQFLDINHIVRLENPSRTKEPRRIAGISKSENTFKNLWGFFSLRSQAEAKPIER